MDGEGAAELHPLRTDVAPTRDPVDTPCSPVHRESELRVPAPKVCRECPQVAPARGGMQGAGRLQEQPHGREPDRRQLLRRGERVDRRPPSRPGLVRGDPAFSSAGHTTPGLDGAGDEGREPGSFHGAGPYLTEELRSHPIEFGQTTFVRRGQDCRIDFAKTVIQPIDDHG
eukprot:scaffold1853_cov245-Pinguiococcus_pyrenoidosus.AAC.2